MTIRLSANRMDMDDKVVAKAMLKDYGEHVNVMGAAGGARDIDITLGNVVTCTVSTSANTFSFSNPSASGTACSFTLILTNGGSQTVNWPAAVDWPDGVVPSLNPDGVDILSFLTTNAGTTWYGFHGGTSVLSDELFSFGLNTSGQLGISAAGNRSSPVQVGTPNRWSVVSGSRLHSLARRSDGTLWSWGSGTDGLLGHATNTTSHSSPVQIGSLSTWSVVATGGRHSLAILTAGTLWSWGRGNYGVLGHTTNTDNQSSPVQVGSLSTWSTVTAGYYHNLALQTDGTLWSWGEGANGRLGLISDINDRSSPVQVGSLSTWRTLSAGVAHSLAIKTDGTLWSWGSGSSGGLGHATNTTSYSSPVQVGILSTWSKVAAGGYTSLAIKTDGTLWSWGNAYYGALGHATNTTYRSSPVQVGSLTTWSSVATGGAFVLATQTDGTLWSWGKGTYGVLGHGNTDNRSSPVQVGSLRGWKPVSHALLHSSAIRKS